MEASAGDQKEENKSLKEQLSEAKKSLQQVTQVLRASCLTHLLGQVKQTYTEIPTDL